jgi:hypothetical protein
LASLRDLFSIDPIESINVEFSAEQANTVSYRRLDICLSSLVYGSGRHKRAWI